MSSGDDRSPAFSPRARRALDELHAKSYNFDPEVRATATAEQGWNIDSYCQPLPSEPPGDPVDGGSWQTAIEVLKSYEFADPSIVRAVFHPDDPLHSRNMLLIGRFYGLRFHLGVRVGGVIDGYREIDGRRARVWGWNYRTLEGHLEQGQLDYSIWKWMDTGEVEFHMDAFSKIADIPNPIIRFGFRVFGRGVQRRFARTACARMLSLTKARMSGEIEPETGRRIDVREERSAEAPSIPQ